jgi:ring-1,2-phenylacetyl-CoA epoxidase subunit PaaD
MSEEVYNMNITQQNVTEESVREALLDVIDPEIPNLSIVDLGIVRGVSVGDSAIEVELLPTFVGCPALEVM